MVDAVRNVLSVSLFQPILFEFQNGNPRFTEWFDLTPRFGETKRNDYIPCRFQRMLVKKPFRHAEKAAILREPVGLRHSSALPVPLGSLEAQAGFGLDNSAGTIAAAAVNDNHFICPLLAEQGLKCRRKRLFLVIVGNYHGNHFESDSRKGRR
jgi:hypothetical protein